VVDGSLVVNQFFPGQKKIDDGLHIANGNTYVRVGVEQHLPGNLTGSRIFLCPIQVTLDSCYEDDDKQQKMRRSFAPGDCFFETPYIEVKKRSNEELESKMKNNALPVEKIVGRGSYH